MQLFYSDNITDNIAVLDHIESKHCLKSLRKKPGDPITVVDGKGGIHEGQLLEPNLKGCLVSILKSDPNYDTNSIELTIAIAPTKNIGRFEWFLEKATEIGISKVIPIITDRSERRKLRTDRLQRIMITAMKQSLKAKLPEITEPQTLNELLSNEDQTDSVKFIAHCLSNEKKHLKYICEPRKNVIILIGPEGDFTEREIELAKEGGYTEISLGKNRLRTETAGIIACHTVNLINE